MQNSFRTSDVEQSTFELIVDQLEELIVTIVEEIRERPTVAAGILAAVVGIVIGSMLVGNRQRQRSAPTRLVRRARGMGEMADLAATGVKLLQNPIVRGLIRSSVQKQLRQRIAR